MRRIATPPTTTVIPPRRAVRRTLAAGLAAGMAVLGMNLFPAAAQAAGATIEMCAWTQAPAGFVDVFWFRNSSCPGSGLGNNAHRAQYIAGDPVGTTMRACTSSALPTGWFATGPGFFSSGCEITSSGGLPPNTTWIQRIY